MRRKALAAVVVLVLLVGCRDGPTGIGITEPDQWNRTSSTPTVLDPLTLVNRLMSDGFVRPLTIEALGRTAADQLAVALEPGSEELAEPDLTVAIRALEAVRLQLVTDRSQPEADLMKTEGADPVLDAEALIVQDALSLVVDDALQILLAADSTGGG